MDRENKPPSLALSGRSSRGNTENEIKMKDLTLSCEPPVSPKPTSSTSTSKSTSTTAKSYKPLPFVEGWELVDVLGEGAYGEVRLARHKVHNEYVAVKVVSINDKNKDLLRKEIGILKMVQHRNIIKFYGDRAVENDNEKQIFIFLEYAENGELFDRIEPDVGMVKKDVFKYFSQLLDGVEYLHENGIVHRDIKPENLLLDHDSNLKISDFGLATLFRCKGRERKLNTCCGTPSYCAPEVLGGGNFYAEPIDVWSCGIVLVAMLAGELPWDEPRDSFKEFDDWKKRFFVNPPWSKLDTLALGLCLKVLNVQPIQRASIPVIRKDPWFVKHLAAASRKRQYSPSTSPSSAQSPSRPYKMVCSRIENSPARVANMDSRHSMAQSQPVTYSPVSKTAAGILDASDVSSNPKDLCGILVMSQPEDFKALAITQTGVGSQRLRMVNRMTRFYSKVTLLETTNIIQRYLEHNGISYKIVDLIITATMMDSRSRRLVWKLDLHNVAAYSLVLVDVRRSKGDGIEFKKQFVKLKTKLNDIICERSPFATGSFF